MFLLYIGEANKQVSDYKFRLKRSQQEVTTLQSSVSINIYIFFLFFFFKGLMFSMTRKISHLVI